VFCPPQERNLKPVLAATGQRSPNVPVVVVTRHPEVSEWLDAMDAGAADYCAAPFEPKQVRWILESNLH
jgi:DNA-binding NtrC family response regulator